MSARVKWINLKGTTQIFGFPPHCSRSFPHISSSGEDPRTFVVNLLYWLVSSVTLLYMEVCNTESLALSIGAGLRPAPTPTNSGSERYTGLCTVGCYRGM